ADARLARGCRPARRAAGLDVPLRHRVDGERRPLGGRALADAGRPGAAPAAGALRDALLDGGAVRRPGEPTPVPAARRDAGAAHGRQAADTRARVAAAAGDPRDVRLQGREVGQAGALRRRADARLLGAARLRRRRLGRPVERAVTVRERPQRPRVSRFSRTERALHWLLAVCFFVLLATGLALYLPSLANVVDRP